MNFGSLARRYARALLKIAEEEGSVEKFGQEVEIIGKFFAENQDAFEALSSSQHSLKERKRAAEKLTERLKTPTVIKNFLLVALEKNRFIALPDIVREFCYLRDQHLGWTRAEVTSAAPLSQEILKRANSLLENKTAKKVFLTEKVNPNMLGGILLKEGGTLYDGSLRSELRRLREKLIRV